MILFLKKYIISFFYLYKKSFYKNYFTKINIDYYFSKLFFFNNKNVFLTYHYRPKFIEQINRYSEININLEKTAVVIQGAIVRENNFTFETLLLYKKLFPNCEIIFSTWEDDLSNDDLDYIKMINITLVQNSKPIYQGHSNINFQIKSTNSAIKLAYNNGAKYILKTRSDQRIYSPDTIPFLINLLNIFNFKKTNLQTNRIITVSLNTFKFRLYGITDMCQFGTSHDMFNYWDCEFDMRVFSQKELEMHGKTIKSYSKANFCEVYLCTSFLKKIKHEIKWTLEDSWYVYSNYFLIIDKESIDLFWNKYSHREYYRRNYYKNFNSFEEISFKDWLNLLNKSNTIFPEEYLNNKHDNF
jgi:hypothetical protein